MSSAKRKISPPTGAHRLDYVEEKIVLNRNQRPPEWQVPIKNSRLTHAQFLHLVYGFAIDQPAIATARYTGVSQRTVNDLYRLMRLRLAEIRDQHDLAEIKELDELWAYHSERHARAPGWRNEDRVYQVIESQVRLKAREWGRYWLLSVLLQSMYDKPLARRSVK